MTTCNQAYRATHHAERQRGDTPKNRDCNTWWLTMAGGALRLAGVAMSGSRSARKAGPASPVAAAAEDQPC